MVGFDAKNKNIVDPKFICGKCTLMIRDPVQLSQCGHRQCQSCVDNRSTTILVCPHCHTKRTQTELFFDRGFQNDMQSLPIECFLCQWNGKLSNYQEHLDQLHPHPKCEYCAEQFPSVDALKQHKESECQQSTVSCSLNDFGCSGPIIHCKLQEHYLTKQHQDISKKTIRQLLSQSPDAPMNTDISKIITSIVSNSTAVAVQEFYKALYPLPSGMETLNDDAQCPTNESLQNEIRPQTATEHVSQVKLSVEESHHFLQGIKHNQDILTQDVASLKEKIDDMQYVSYDGTYVWTITNLREKLLDAQSERQTSIYSPPFYSSPTGYKMRVRLYLNGDGNARRTHMSLFFVLMKGINDPYLKFPFNYKATFCLYDQSQNPTLRHIVDSFRPDIRSNSFQRPRSEMNIASGIPKFFPLAMIEQEGSPYVRDDTMFIKIMIDFGDMPRTLVPYALSLNPGLPIDTQQTMIREEAARRA